MNLKATIALTAFAVALGLAALPVHAADYTCDDDGPCIVKADRVGKYKVRLNWSGQRTSYDFYKIIVRLHGGGDSKDYPYKGGEKGKSTLNLKRAGDYEITVAGCDKPAVKGDEADCRLSSEKVRMNLY